MILRANMTPLVFRVFGRSKREVVIGNEWKYAWQVHIYIALMAHEWHMYKVVTRT